MIIYNFDRVFKARGINKRFAYLKRAGFSDSLASKLKNNDVAMLNLKTIETLCLILVCTPNDFMEWIPDQELPVDPEHPIYRIQQTNKVVDITKTLSTVPLDKLDAIEALIKNEINKQSID